MPRYNWDTIEQAIKQANINVQPHWLDDCKTFWYLRQTTRKEFWKIDIETATKQLAFDHNKLAEALSQQVGEDFDPWDLPFSQINTNQNDNDVRFRFRTEKFEFNPNGNLTVFHGSLNENELKPDSSLKQSEDGGERTLITIVNETETEVQCDWLDPDGNVVSYGTVKRHDCRILQTFAGHVWKLSKVAGEEIGEYKASEAPSLIKIQNESSDDVFNSSMGPSMGEDVVTIDGDRIWIRRPDGSNYELRGKLPSGTQWHDHVDESPDRSFAIAWQKRPAQDHPLHLIDHAPPNQLFPELTNKQYLRPGDDIEILQPRLFNVNTKQETTIGKELFENPYKLDTIGWNKDSSEFLFIYNARGRQVLRVIGIDREGNVRTVTEDKSTTFIDYSSKQYFRVLENTKELLWASERNGWNRLYLIDMQSGDAQPVTPSGQVFVSVDHIDEDTRRIWCTVRGSVPGQDPYYDHLIRVNFDGSDTTRLTQGNGTHSWTWSPDHKYLVDSWSRVDKPPQTVVRKAETGEQLMILEEGDIEILLKQKWTTSELFSAPGRDGETPIFGIIVKPSTFDPEKRYAVIEDIYAGPHHFFVPKKFGTDLSHHELAEELDCVVVVADGMGTNWRSKAFHDVCWKNLKDAGFPDRMAWIRTAAAERHWMDLDRVGIYGVSAGGQTAMVALLEHSKFYKAAVADSGCHDNRVDKVWWNEQWMGWPVDKSYEESSNVVNAHKLEGNLMLVVGMLDTNVDPACTLQVVKALNDADKDYELVVEPRGGHGVLGSSKYAKKRMRNFFKKHLLERASD